MFSTYVNADDFSIRNDIHFGDSIETVKEKEVLGFCYESPTSDEDGLMGLMSNIGTIAGIDDSQVTYYFYDNELCEIDYGLDTTERNLNTLKSNYNDIYDGLIRKYGKPLYNDSKKEGKHEILTNVSTYVNSWLGISYSALDYNEWVKEYDNYNIKIDLSCTYKPTDNGIESACIYVGYKYFTDETIQEIQEKDKIKQEEKQKLIDDDL